MPIILRLSLLVLFALASSARADVLVLASAKKSEGASEKSSEHGKKSDGQGGTNVPLTNFVPLEPFVVPIIRNGQLQRHVTLSITIEAKDQDAKGKVEASMPRLRDAFARDLHAYLAVVPYDGSGALLQAMMQRLARVADGAVGAGRIKAVLLQGVGDRKISFAPASRLTG
ncbi:MAG: flagellar basal body-associated protein FliL [Alphaproteobacteria bacterium]